MNICIATSTFPLNTADVMRAPFLAPLIERLQAEGHHVCVLTQEREGERESVFPKVDVVTFGNKLAVNVAELPLNNARNAWLAAQLIADGTRAAMKLAKAREIHLFICLWAVPSGLYIYLGQRLGQLRTPYFIWALGSDINKLKKNATSKQILRRVLRGASARFAVGFELREEVERISGLQCQFLSAFRRLPGGGAPAKASPDARPKFLFVGRHTKVKGIDILFDAVSELKRRGVSAFELLVASEGELTQKLKERVQNEALERIVSFAGKVDDTALRALYEAADCVVIPSRSEGFPLVFGEALQMSRPLIVSEVAGMGEVARKYSVATAVPSENPVALADAMQAFIARPFSPNEVGRLALLDLLVFESSVQTLIDRVDALQIHDSDARKNQPHRQSAL